MAIRRGVSCYSYQNLIFDRKMDWKSFIRTVREELDTDGIELIDETFIRDYPFISDEFVYSWRNEIARYGMKSVTMDVYLDVLQFRDHVMTHEEAAERLRRDLTIASKLGFENIRCLVTTPLDAIESCIPHAEEMNVRIGIEIHAPAQIIYNKATNRFAHFEADPQVAEKIIEMRERTGTKHLGLVPDMGLFQHEVSPSSLRQMRRANPAEVIDYILENKGKMSEAELNAKVQEKYPAANIFTLGRLIQPQGSENVEALKVVAPYIVSIHGKFYDMVEDAANPGHYKEASIDYPAIFKNLKEGGFDGYINSEFEGQGAYNDLPDEEMVDEREEVRRHHAMMKDLGAI